jgi:hypothetical protein
MDRVSKVKFADGLAMHCIPPDFGRPHGVGGQAPAKDACEQLDGGGRSKPSFFEVKDS